MPLVAFCLRHFLADFIICMCEFDFRQAQRFECLLLARLRQSDGHYQCLFTGADRKSV
jgi:hypothetical protein